MKCVILHKSGYFKSFVNKSCFWSGVAIPATIHRSAQEPSLESALRNAFWAILGTWLGVPTECFLECFLALLEPKKCQEARAQKRQKPLKKHSVGHSEPGAQKHSVGHFPGRAPGYSCKWRLGSQIGGCHLSLYVGNRKNYLRPKNPLDVLVGHSDGRLGKQVTTFSRHTRPLSVNFAELPIQISVEFEVGNGKNELHPEIISSAFEPVGKRHFGWNGVIFCCVVWFLDKLF